MLIVENVFASLPIPWPGRLGGLCMQQRVRDKRAAETNMLSDPN